MAGAWGQREFLTRRAVGASPPHVPCCLRHKKGRQGRRACVPFRRQEALNPRPVQGSGHDGRKAAEARQHEGNNGRAYARLVPLAGHPASRFCWTRGF